jgi:hypothetical protein
MRDKKTREKLPLATSAQLGYLTVFALVFYFWINLNIRGAINATAKANIAYFKNCM